MTSFLILHQGGQRKRCCMATYMSWGSWVLYILELCTNLSAVTPLTLLELSLAFPAVTPQHCYDARRPIARIRMRRSWGPPAGVRCRCTQRVKSGRCIKSMNPKNTSKSPIHENADTNITCDFGGSDISRLGVANQTHVYKQTSFVSWIIVRFFVDTHALCFRPYGKSYSDNRRRWEPPPRLSCVKCRMEDV